MKTLQQNPLQAKQPDSSCRITRLPASARRALLVFTGLWLLQTASFAQSNIFTGVFWTGANHPGYINVAGQCNTDYQPKVSAVQSSSCLPLTPWTITITDSASVSLQIEGLHLSAVTHTLLTSADLLPSFNLTTLAAGNGTLKVTDPCSNTETFALKIVTCDNNGVALVPELGFQSVIAPNKAAQYYVQVANVGISPSSATTRLEVRDIPIAADCEVDQGEMSLGQSAPNEKQFLTVDIGTVNPITQTGFRFDLKATPSTVIGSTFTMTAEIGTPHFTTDSQLITVIASLDPNAKYGPAGYGPFHTISKKTTLPYLITFENDPSALAPAQIVTITDYLDTTKVEPASVQFGPVHFGSKVVAPPAGANPFTVTVPYDVDNNPITTADNIFVRISGSVDQNQFSGTYGKVEWMFESLDAPNGNPPPINIGFLPANIMQPEGDGGVTFTVSQKANLAPGTLITNVASIVFDVNAPILTPVWTNRIVIPSTLAIDRPGSGQARVTWSGGVLEQADSLPDGNWSDAPVQASPWTFNPAGPQKFFRVRND